jgi:hypothetical protein
MTMFCSIKVPICTTRLKEVIHYSKAFKVELLKNIKCSRKKFTVNGKMKRKSLRQQAYYDPFPNVYMTSTSTYEGSTIMKTVSYRLKTRL